MSHHGNSREGNGAERRPGAESGRLEVGWRENCISPKKSHQSGLPGLMTDASKTDRRDVEGWCQSNQCFRLVNGEVITEFLIIAGAPAPRPRPARRPASKSFWKSITRLQHDYRGNNKSISCLVSS
jgi:hypothetical protein